MKRLVAGLGGLVLIAAAWFLLGPRTAVDRSTQTGQREREVANEVAPWFADVTADWGLDFVHEAALAHEFFMPAQAGSGSAVFDFDNDGRLDIYLVQNGGPGSKSENRLYRQNAERRFVDVSRGSGLDVAGYGMGVAAGDVTNDGWPDLVLTEYRALRLFINQRDGTFKDVTQEARLENPEWGTSAAFCDYDRDGWLDLVIANYVDFDPQTVCDDRAGRVDFCGPSTFSGTVSRLFKNRGLQAGSEGGTPLFEDVTVASGLGSRTGPALGVICSDLTGDGWVDILIANDGAANHLWVNQHNGTFREEAVIRGLAYDSMAQPQANMGIAVGDVDGDGLDDIFITHLHTELHIAWKQGPAGFFQDVTGRAGLATPDWRSTGFGTLFADFDHDGALDLALANGRVRRDDGSAPAADTKAFWEPYLDRNQLFANDGTGRFRDVSRANDPFCGSRGIARGLAVGDVDGDGALDLLETRIAAPARLFRNVATPRGHWLTVRAIDPALGGRDMYGAVVTISAANREWTRTINPGYSYLCSNSPWAHFGLGDTVEVASIEVIWPDGASEVFPGGAVDRFITLRKGEAQPQ